MPKTEFYRDFVGHLEKSHDRFIAAEGTRGMVMLVFTLPSYDVVFKLIRDRFDPPKDTDRARCDAAVTGWFSSTIAPDVWWKRTSLSICASHGIDSSPPSWKICSATPAARCDWKATMS